ncbi:protein transport protein Sec16A isoform X2 [Betta splendens]|uniref:Protein transport protein sec16 n=1 Tax=Betta splendens TaxID=158456 RepID=A0A8M1HKU9_BETSP|nr:protein transport protein Sec16A isoform X2 [Betta splendens]
MQPPPRTGPPGASGPPPPSGPNMFRRTRPHKQTAAAPAAIQPATQPTTDPFAFARTTPSVAAGAILTIPNSNPQAPPNTIYSPPGGGLPPQPQPLHFAAAPLGAPPSSLPGVTMFNPNSTSPSPGVFQAATPGGYASSNAEQAYFNSREQSSMATETPPLSSAPIHSPFNLESQFSQSGPLQPVPPPPSSSQWVPDHGSRPPSVQNYFQPTSDPLPQPFNIPPQTQMYPSHATPSHHNFPTPPTQPGHSHMQACLTPQIPVKPPSSSFADPNVPQQHNSHFQTQSHFSQGSTAQDSLLNQFPQDSGYHQMGTGLSHHHPHPQPQADFAGSQHGSNTGPVPSTAHDPVPYSQESSTLSMFFKDSDVENEETLAGEKNKTVNGVPGPYQHHSVPHGNSSQADVPLGYQGTVQDGIQVTQGAHDSQYDLVENLECVPNQEVLPSETPGSPAASAAHLVDHFETGPNLETPDSVPRPIRPASVSSNYSNMSHGSGTGSRRHQGVVGTFIQQESPRLTDEANPPAGTGEYFEQIDSPAGAEAIRQSSLEQMWPPTPSPPKPTGIFQASANSSFEPVRSHGVGVRPAEVDMANIVAESGTDSTPGNLELPPDNMENIYSPGHSLPPGAGGGVPHLTHPVVHSHSRPSSRAFGANRPCDSPATTLWAQNDPTSLSTNILLAPAAPAVLAPVREPSADVIQPPEDSPLDLQPSQRVQQTPQQNLENLENPPKVSEAEQTDSQGNLGYASLLLSESLHQPVLIAPPVSNCSVISPNVISEPLSQISFREAAPPVRSLSQGLPAGTSQPTSLTSNLNPLFTPGSISFPASTQGPLNLTRENTEAAKSSEITAPMQAQLVHAPLSRDQSLTGDNHSSPQVNSHASLATAAVSNHSQPSNYELLDFSMHQSQPQNQAPGHLHESLQASNGFYLQVTKDAQQGLRMEGSVTVQNPASSTTPQVPSQAAANTQAPPTKRSETSDSQPSMQGKSEAPPVPVSTAQPSHGQYAVPAQGPATGGAPPPPAAAYPPGQLPQGASQPATAEPPQPPSSAGIQQGYGPPPLVSGQMYSGYYGNYGEYPDSRAPYPPGQYPPPFVDPRAQQYYQDASYRSWYGRYDSQAAAYRDPNYQYRDPQPERPNSRSSQYSDRPSSRQGYADDYHRANRSAYNDYYTDYSKNYDQRAYNYGQYDPRYRGYYDQAYWSNYDDSYRGRENYYNQHMYPTRREGYDDQWRYYPGYDPSFDDEYQRNEADEFDRRSVHSERSAHSVHSHHSRQSSFSSRSQQSQVYRSQPDLVSAYDNTASTLAVDYSYGQYPNTTDAMQNYSQYLYPSEYPTESTRVVPDQSPPRPTTPEKFTIPHRCARFGPGGHLVQVLPNLPSAGQPALVDIHSMETMLQDTRDQSELRAFPGPLVKEETHKVDVIKFSQNKAVECSRDNNLLDRDSARLLWDFIVLLCRQNGTVVGTDIADLLLKEHRSVWLPGKSPNEANLIDFNNEPLSRAEEEPGAGPLSLLSDTFMTVPENVGKETERFRELLLFGRKKDALEAAMKGGLWGHALLLASKMDNRTHARVMTRFANSLPINDPLQTVYQLMSGRMPASATCCGEEKWGDWRPHLAMVLSNLTHTLDLDTRTITTMGDTLASKGLIDAAHFCYLMAQVGLGVFTKKSTKMVLIGSNHSFPFFQFATNEAIQRTEAYEYAQSLGSQPCSLPNFQVFKLIYACRLAEAGLCAQAFHYCEVISRNVLMQPSYYSPVFISQIIQMSEKLRFFDPQLKEKPEQELFNEPEWLIELRQLDGHIRTGVITYNADRTTPTQFDCSTPSSELEQPSPLEHHNLPGEGDGTMPDNQLMHSLLPGPPPHGVQLMPPAPTSILRDGMAPPQPLSPSNEPQFYPVPPVGPPSGIPVSGYPSQDPGFAPPPFQPQPENPDMYAGANQQQFAPSSPRGQMSPHMPPQVPHSPVLPPSHIMPPSPGHMPHVDQPFQAPPVMQTAQPIPSSPVTTGSLTPKMDFYDHMSHMGAGRRSRTTSQSSVHMAPGRRSRTTSESSTHSAGRERSNSVINPVSPPPPSIPEQPRQEDLKKAKKDSPKKGGGGGGGGGWLNWLYRKGKNEAHLPDDKNKSIVWDEKKQRWVDLNEPEEESKPPPPPPSGFPKMAPMPGPGGPAPPMSGGPPVNMFSRKAGTKSRYVDVLNPSRAAKPGGLAPAPVNMFAPLAPMPMPANLFVPTSAPDNQQPLEASEGGNQEQNTPENTSTAPQMFNPTLLPPAPEGSAVPDGSQSGESHPPQGAPPTGGIPFYNPAQFAQTSAPSGGGLRSGRLGGQRQYPVLK